MYGFTDILLSRATDISQGAVGVLGMLSPWLYGRYNAISVIVGNRPGNLPEINAFSAHQVLYEDTIRNCEHGLLEENEGFALLSCDPGRDWWNTVMVSAKVLFRLTERVLSDYPPGRLHLIIRSAG